MIRQDPFDEDLETGSAVRLRGQARGFIGLQGLRFALYLSTAGILPAILDPSAFSSLIQLGPIYMVVMVIADFGLGTHTTRTRGIDRGAASFSFWWSMAIALAVAIALMQILRISHPPAGSNPFIVFLLGANWDYLWMPTLIGSVLIVLVALFYNNISEVRSYPKYW